MIKKVTLVSKGVRELLQSKEAMQLCKDYAYKAQEKLGEGYSVTYMIGKNRVNAEVAAVSAKAIRENMKHNTILKAVSGGDD